MFHANIDGNCNDGLKTLLRTLFSINCNECCSLNEGYIAFTSIKY